jgi:poly-beta-1,6-N-acetyl-D-glucosamine synthase
LGETILVFTAVCFPFLCKMMTVAFYTSLFVLLYTYVGYAVIIYVISLFRKKVKPSRAARELPAVTLIIPAYNEAECLPAKLENCRQLEYPADKLKIIVVTDGSTDSSNKLVERYPGVQLLFEPARTGKMAAINRSMQYVNTPVVVFSDANTLLNPSSIKNIVAHYADESVGGVAGEKKVNPTADGSLIGFGEGLYWKYESALKQLDSDFNTVVGAAGELFSMRTSLFQPQDEQVILDDFILSMKLCIEGYKVVYEPNAYAQEVPSTDIFEEKKRRTRIAAGAFQSIPKLWPYLMLVNRPVLYFQYFSRRILRWIGCPICLLVCFFSNGFLAAAPDAPVLLQVCFIAQTLFYATAAWGGLNYKRGSATAWYIPFYFMFMHVSLVQGFVKYVTRGQSVLWDKSKRRMALETIN